MAARTKKWPQDVTDSSDAMDLKNGIFKEKSTMKIPETLGRTQSSPQGDLVPICHADAHILHQSCWRTVAEIAEGGA